MAEEARQSVGWWALDEERRRRVIALLRLPSLAAVDGEAQQAAATALETPLQERDELIYMTKELAEAYQALHECVVYQTRSSCVSADVQRALGRLEQLGIISAAGREDHPETIVVRTLSKALGRHKAHGVAGLAEIAAEQIADLKRQLRRYDMTQRMMDKLLDKWKAHAQKHKRELKRLRKRIDSEKQLEVSLTALRFWLCELVDAVDNPQQGSVTPRQVVDHLEKQFPGWRG